MKVMPILVSIVLLAAGLPSCKSHKATVVRPSGQGSKIERTEADKVGKNELRAEADKSDPMRNVDPEVGDVLVRTARTWIGTPYRYGGQSKSGTDCSGMLMVIYKDVADVSLPRNSAEQRDYCFDIDQYSLQPGDLVFFTTSTQGGKVSHVGMYVGGGKIIHASTSRGVIESSLEENYYKTHYHSSGRVYGITRAATGNSIKETSKPTEITLDQFIAGQQSEKTLADTATVAEPVVSVRPITNDQSPTTNSLVADSIRRTVVKAMNFGK